MKVEIEIPDQLITDIIVAALIAGVDWCRVTYRSKDHLYLTLVEHDGNVIHTVFPEDWPRAIRMVAFTNYKHFADMIKGTGNAATGDVLLQLVALGTIKYGHMEAVS